MRIEITGIEESEGRLSITVGAFDAGGKPLVGLNKENYLVSLDGRPLPVLASKTATESVASILLLVDVSGSMAGAPIQLARQAMLEFVAGVSPTDQVAIMTFASSVQKKQDFTNDRSVLERSISGLAPEGETALYDAVIAGASLFEPAVSGRRLVVLLSDGLSTTGLEKRDQSLAAAQASGASFVVVGLGASLDRQYLGVLAATTGGRLLDAPTPAALQQTYRDLAAAIRNQYTLTVEVPPSIDRTVSGRLRVNLNYLADTASTERLLAARTGARAPGFDFSVVGLIPGQKLRPGQITIAPAEGLSVQLAKVTYAVGDAKAWEVVTPPFGWVLDTADLQPGSYILKVTATDITGRIGQTELPFAAESAPSGGSMTFILIPVGLVLVAGAGAGALSVIRKRNAKAAILAERAQPWSIRNQDILDKPPADWPEIILSPARGSNQTPLGRVVLINEDAIREGNLDSISEYEVGITPLSIGVGSGNHICLEDEMGRIAMEEARLWVQKESLVYHKLSTLSAMATSGLTNGWQFIASGEEIVIGPYRLVFEAYPEAPGDEVTSEPDANLDEEHGYLGPAGRALEYGSLSDGVLKA